MPALNKKGFTLVELSLSIAFIAILSIIIVILITNTISSYRRGLTMNKINSVGMDLADEMRAALQNSTSSAVTNLCYSLYGNDSSKSEMYDNCMADGGKNFVSMVKYNNNGEPLYGVFCTGNYSYVWNTGYYFSERGAEMVPESLSIEGGGKKKKSNFKLLKMMDTERKVCSTWIQSKYAIENNNIPNKLTVPEEIFDKITDDVLGGSMDDKNDNANDLAIYYLDSAIPAETKSGHNLFYSVSFVLGTIQGGINVNASGNFCSTLDKSFENMDFCAINKFNFAVRATGE